MKKHTSTFVRLDYSILSISDLNSTDKIVLAYNHGDWGNKGYFASNAHAAKELCMNIKTFEKSALKLKKMGLWMVRGQTVKHNALPAQVGGMPTQIGDIPSQVGSMPATVGTIPTRVDEKQPVLPLKPDTLLDRLLDNRLDKDKIELLNNASCAAKDIAASSNYLNNSVSEDILGSSIINSDTALVSKISKKVAHESNTVMMSDVDMVSANLKAWLSGKPEPYTKEDMSKARNRTPIATSRSSKEMDDFWNSDSSTASASTVPDDFELMFN